MHVRGSVQQMGEVLDYSLQIHLHPYGTGRHGASHACVAWVALSDPMSAIWQGVSLPLHADVHFWC